MSLDLFTPQVRQDPYPTYAELRRTAPVYHDQRRDLWLVGRYADVTRVLSDPGTFSSVGNSIEDRLAGADPPAHTRVRTIIQRPFTSARIKALADIIRGLARDLIDRVSARGE